MMCACEGIIMKRMLKRRWPTIPPISTKRTTISRFKPLYTQNTMTYMEDQVLAWDTCQKVVALNRLMRPCIRQDIIYSLKIWRQEFNKTIAPSILPIAKSSFR